MNDLSTPVSPGTGSPTAAVLAVDGVVAVYPAPTPLGTLAALGSLIGDAPVREQPRAEVTVTAGADGPVLTARIGTRQDAGAAATARSVADALLLQHPGSQVTVRVSRIERVVEP